MGFESTDGTPSGSGVGSGGGSGGTIDIQDEGVLVSSTGILNFIGAAITAITDPPNSRVNVDVSAIGDMTKAVYDTNNNGVVDDSEKLNGQLPTFYLDRVNHTGTQLSSTISDFQVAVSNNADVSANSAHRLDLNNPHQVSKAQVGLGDLENIKSNYSATSPPTVNNDSSAGYSVGSVWIDVSNDRSYICLDNSLGNAVWHRIDYIIDDLVVSAVRLWSSQKISDELAQKSDVVHTHAASDITDFQSAVSSNADVSANSAHRVDLNNPHQVSKAQVGLGNVENIKNNYGATTAPTVNDDSSVGYSVGSIWVDTTADVVYVAVDVSVGAAIWKDVVSLLSHTHTSGDITDFQAAVSSNVDVSANSAHRVDLNNPHQVSKAQVGLGNVENIKNNYSATVAPTAVDDSSAGYSIGSVWVDTSSDTVYIAVDVSVGAAIWKDVFAMVSHTHTASDITDFQTAVSGNADVSANTNARHTHNNLSILDATTASYTIADKNKLDGIEVGATADQLASEVPFDNTYTGYVGTDVQAVIDEGVKHFPIVMRADGYLRVVSGLDFHVVNGDRKIHLVKVYRRVGGLSGSTVVDILKNGSSIFTTTGKPTILSSAGDGAIVSVVPDIVDLSSNDVLNFDILSVESGEPQDLVIEIY